MFYRLCRLLEEAVIAKMAASELMVLWIIVSNTSLLESVVKRLDKAVE